MTWTTPKTWDADELVTATVMNTQIRDNLNALKFPPSAAHVLDESSEYTTTSTTFVDVDSTALALTITTHGGDVMVQFHGNFRNSAGDKICLDVAVDDVRVAGEDGIMAQAVGTGMSATLTFTRLITGLSAGAHTFKLQWRVVTGTATLFAGAGTVNNQVHGQFWVREVS